MGAQTRTQDHFAFYFDDAGDRTNTIISAGQDAASSGDFVAGTTFKFRAAVAVGGMTSSWTPTLEWADGTGGSFNAVGTASTAKIYITAGSGADGTASTQRISSPDTFTAGKHLESRNGTSNEATGTVNNTEEWVYTLGINGTVAAGSVFKFKMNGMNSYAGTGTLTTNADVSSSPGLGSATVSGFTPGLQLRHGLSFGTATISGFAPERDYQINLSLGTATVSGFEMYMQRIYTFGLGTATASGFSPALNDKRNLGFGTATISGFVPTWGTVAVGLSKEPGLGTATVSGLAPALLDQRALSLGTATISGFAPKRDHQHNLAFGTATASGFGLTLRDTRYIGFGTATVAGLSPTVNLMQSREPDLGSATISGFAPTVSQFSYVAKRGMKLIGL